MKKILVVDDELDILDSVEAALEIGGYTIIRCHEPMMAVDIAKTQKPDLMILDVMMPLRTGPELLLEMKSIEETKNIPTILMSAGKSTKYDQDTYKWDLFMTKPFDLEELLSNVKKLI